MRNEGSLVSVRVGMLVVPGSVGSWRCFSSAAAAPLVTGNHWHSAALIHSATASRGLPPCLLHHQLVKSVLFSVFPISASFTVCLGRKADKLSSSGWPLCLILLAWRDIWGVTANYWWNAQVLNKTYHKNLDSMWHQQKISKSHNKKTFISEFQCFCSPSETRQRRKLRENRACVCAASSLNEYLMQCLLLGTLEFITHNAAANFPKAQIHFLLLLIKFDKAQSLQEAP